jgi:hypothetical protein
MGLFDLFRGKDKGGDGKKKSSPAAKWAEAAGDKRAQNYDRQEALTELSQMGTSDAVEALLRRFNFTIDPSITDQEEKELAYQGILKAGGEAIIPVRGYAAKAESLGWPIKVVKELLDEDLLIKELLVWLSKWDTEYAKFIEPKLQLLVALEEYTSADIVDGVLPFIEDVNDQARFNAVTTLLAQNDERVVEPLRKLFPDEESVRIRNKIADAFVDRGWAIPDDEREPMRKALPPAFTINAEGKLQKR